MDRWPELGRENGERGQYGGEGADGALEDLSDEITRFTLDQPDPLSLPPLRLHIDPLMPVSTCSYVGKPHGQIQFNKYLPSAYPAPGVVLGCSEAKGGPLCQESSASLCYLWVSLALRSSTSSSV